MLPFYFFFYVPLFLSCMSELTSVIGPLRRLCESSAAAVAKSLLPTLIAGVSCMEGANAPVKYVLSCMWFLCCWHKRSLNLDGTLLLPASEEEYARTGNPVFKQQVISACEKALGSYQVSRSYYVTARCLMPLSSAALPSFFSPCFLVSLDPATFAAFAAPRHVCAAHGASGQCIGGPNHQCSATPQV